MKTRGGDAFFLIHMPQRPTIKQMVALEDLLNDFGMSTIGADCYQRTMAYVAAKIFDVDLVVVP